MDNLHRKSKKIGVGSGCIIWILVFIITSGLLCPLSIIIGSLTSTLQSGLVARTLEPYLCPANSTAEIITFQTTSQDEYSNSQSSTGYEMQCVGKNGEIVKAPSPAYAFIWIGILAAGSLILSTILSFFLAAPAGVLIARLIKRKQNNISP